LRDVNPMVSTREPVWRKRACSSSQVVATEEE
jgi:hypothetical protein